MGGFREVVKRSILAPRGGVRRENAGVSVRYVDVRRPGETAWLLEQITSGRPDTLYVVPDGVGGSYESKLLDFAARPGCRRSALFRRVVQQDARDVARSHIPERDACRHDHHGAVRPRSTISVRRCRPVPCRRRTGSHKRGVSTRYWIT